MGTFSGSNSKKHTVLEALGLLSSPIRDESVRDGDVRKFALEARQS